MYLIGCILAMVVLYALISKVKNDANIALHYQKELFEHVKSLVDDSDTPDSIAEMAFFTHKLATSRFGTLFFLVSWFAAALERKDPALKKAGGAREAFMAAPPGLKQKCTKMLFAMAMVLERRSLLLGWLVFPTILSKRASLTVHPSSIEEAMRYETIFRMKANDGPAAHC